MTRYKYIDENKEHLHTLDRKPLIGTSTAMNVIAKPLTWWAAGLAVSTLGWVNSQVRDPETKRYIKTDPAERLRVCNEMLEKIKVMEPEAYLKLLDDAYKAHSTTLKEKAGAGTDLHAELERFVKNRMGANEGLDIYDAQIKPFIEWADANVDEYLWSEGHCYSEKYWVGGISDAGVLLKSGHIAIIDFKSSKEAYASQFFQIAGYDIQISENGVLTKDGELVYSLPINQKIKYHIVFPFGAANPKPDISWKVDTNKEGFRNAVGLYKSLQDLDAI